MTYVVPSLSWQNDLAVFSTNKNGVQKKAAALFFFFFFLPRRPSHSVDILQENLFECSFPMFVPSLSWCNDDRFK